MILRLIFALALVFLTTHAARAATVWNETTASDLSGNGQSPTPLNFAVGTNTVQGSMGILGPGNIDADIFSITLAAGQQLTSIVVDSISGPGHNSFYAVDNAATISLSDGSSHLSNFLIGGPGEYFQKLAAPEYGGAGHTGPLGPGTYTFWFQETQVQRAYTMTYTVVPEPASFVLAAFAFCALAFYKRVQRRTAIA